MLDKIEKKGESRIELRDIQEFLNSLGIAFIIFYLIFFV